MLDAVERSTLDLGEQNLSGCRIRGPSGYGCWVFWHTGRMLIEEPALYAETDAALSN